MGIQRYREDYPGEFVITDTVFRGGKKEQNREWIDNPIDVTHVSARATCIAASPLLKESLYERIQKNNGGLLSKQQMQTYGVESVWKKMTPNFIICQQDDDLKEMIMRGYSHKSIVYTRASQCIKYPGEFYLIPYSLAMYSYAAAAWMACFDHHKEVYLVGYDITKADGEPHTKMVKSLIDVMKTYKGVKFIHVTNHPSPKEWRERLNFSSMPTNEYISHCDV